MAMEQWRARMDECAARVPFYLLFVCNIFTLVPFNTEFQDLVDYFVDYNLYELMESIFDSAIYASDI
eukprot:763138-Hanusia_phi.AAC.7